MLVDFHLIGDVDHLRAKVVLLVEGCLVLHIEFEALIFEVISLFHNDIQSVGKGIVDKFVFKDLS